MLTTLAVFFLWQVVSIGAQNVTSSSDCSCGFRDPKTQEVFTESIILYFNETQSVDQHIFEVRSFRNKNQRGWNTIFPQGASPVNIQFGRNATWEWQEELNTTQPSMQMILDPPLRYDHLSVGAELRSMRRDIQYGTFRSEMRSAQPWVGGSAMSMYVKYNASQDVELDLLNMNNASLAKVMQTVNGEYPSTGLAVNYTAIENGTAPGFPPRSPWDFMDVRFDWNETVVNFWINGNNSRHITKDDRTIPEAPGTFYFSHWSTGDRNYMQGPPQNGSYGSVKWIRAFFNSSLMTNSDHTSYDERCSTASQCSVDDVSLRGSTDYSRAATRPWKAKVQQRGLRDAAGFVAAAFSFFGVAAIVNALIRRGPWHKLKKVDIPGTKRHSTNALRKSLRDSLGIDMGMPFPRPLSTQHPYETLSSTTASGYGTPAPGYTSRGENHVPYPFLYPSRGDSGSATPLPAYDPGQGMLTPAPKRATSQKSLRSIKSRKSLKSLKEKFPSFEVPEAPNDISMGKIMTENTGIPDALTGGATAEPTKEQLPQAPKVPQTQQRIDYLAGLVAVSCVMVTFRHFALTFWPYIVEAQGTTMHFAADKILSYIIGPYVLTPLWIGPFFVTSCRFLAQRYLKTGKFEDIANKMLLRAPRMLIPVFIFMTLTYFLLSLGLTGRLEWLPSVSYSVWPYVVPQGNFGIFLNQLVELSYIIPNNPPEVINNYCVGVLWTIPVQLQFSFVVLLATVLIKDIKKPWKRMSFYIFSMAMGWYGSSWSACHWLGLMLADVDITYDWRRKIQARAWLLYPILVFATILTLATPLVLLFNSAFYFFSFMSWDNAIHPETTTGRPLYETLPSIWYAYPEYFAPTFAHLAFSFGLQLIVELSVWVQKALSIKLVTFFHPHIMTLYLLHGFIFWSLGAYVAVSMSDLGLPYWAILMITAAVCYACLLVVTIIITPLIEFATKGATKNVWRWATEEPVPHRKTTAPFNKELILGRAPAEGEPNVNQARRPSERSIA
ncbi:hypothetical protein CERZMDRAFT_32291 [Cercospora zeae-maydis SCOH1-5]|uniref:GH16 domain-containing protein n=1 Tax=Cercospora zeae-maydis SCOH1-5 TaxID=717836 RepID=A0A6A6FUW4_9PEZI|nr:hypothetical protein CERZMDRAFT_32291 [Cercospora zeae-maydis SCOH1-5]